MKKVLLLLLFCLFLITLPGCEQLLENQQDDNQGGVIEEQDNNQEEEQYPQEIAFWLENMREYFVAGDIILNGERYIVINWGEKRTAGYQLSIENIEETDDQFVVTVLFVEPDEEEKVAQMLTYPHAVRQLEDLEKDVNFIAEGDEEYIPQVVGQQPIKPFVAENNNIKILNFSSEEDRVSVDGLARVFEANVNYSFEDEEGNELQEGYITAAMAGPYWGSFAIDIVDPPDGASIFKVYSISMKDGTVENLIEFDI